MNWNNFATSYTVKSDKCLCKWLDNWMRIIDRSSVSGWELYWILWMIIVHQCFSLLQAWLWVYRRVSHTTFSSRPSDIIGVSLFITIVEGQTLLKSTGQVTHNKTFEFFHNSRPIRRIQQNKIYKKFRDFTRNWTQITCLTVRHLNHYTKLFSVPVWGCNWILFMFGWFCPIRLIHLIGWKSLHFEKTRLFIQHP